MKALVTVWWTVRRLARHHGGAAAGLGGAATVLVAVALGVTMISPSDGAPDVRAGPSPTTAPGSGTTVPTVDPDAVSAWNADGTPVRFGCTAEPITVAYDADGEPYPAGPDVEAAVLDLAGPLGRDLRYEARDLGEGEVAGTIAVRWVPTAADLPGAPDVTALGTGGATTEEVVSGHSEVVSGTVTLNAAGDHHPGGGPDGTRQVYLHEILHALGAGHRDEGTTETVMTPLF